MSIGVIIIAEGECNGEVYGFPTQNEASAFCRGVRAGSRLYGAGSCSAYTLDDVDGLSTEDEDEAREIELIRKYLGNNVSKESNMATEEKPILTGLVRDSAATPEGKYLVKRRDGSVVEWPNFVLGARDPHAAVALRAYADSIATDADCHPDFAARLRRLADEFEAYRATHGNGDPTRGIHRTDDPATIAEMRRGHSA